MKFLESSCSFEVLDEELINSTKLFECSNLDLNDFFQNDCIAFANELMGKTYCFTLDSDSKNIVCSFTISNDSIKTSILARSSGFVIRSFFFPIVFLREMRLKIVNQFPPN